MGEVTDQVTLQPLQPFQKTQLQPALGPSVDSLCHPWFTTTNLSYRLPIFQTSATALRGTTCNYMLRVWTDIPTNPKLGTPTWTTSCGKTFTGRMAGTTYKTCRSQTSQRKLNRRGRPTKNPELLYLCFCCFQFIELYFPKLPCRFPVNFFSPSSLWQGGEWQVACQLLNAVEVDVTRYH